MLAYLEALGIAESAQEAWLREAFRAAFDNLQIAHAKALRDFSEGPNATAQAAAILAAAVGT